MHVRSVTSRRIASVLVPTGALALLGLAVVGVVQAAQQEPARVDTHDDLLVRVDQQAPGFGGMFIDADGRLAVYLIDISRLAATRSAIDAVFGSSNLPAEARAVQAQYSVSQLKTWSDRLSTLLEMPAVTMVDLDEAKNRVVVGLADDSGREAVERRLSSLDVPRAAAVLKVVGEIRRVAPQ
jgi:hypothetical protein